MEAHLPFNFSWFVEELLAAMGFPSDADIGFLSAAGVKTLINLTPDDHYSEVAERLGVKVVSMKTTDFCPPSLEHINQFIRIVESARSQGGKVCVHCMMGRGRTGTVLACYLVAREGYSADEAIAETRRRRRYSIETHEQEQAVRGFAKSLKQREEDEV